MKGLLFLLLITQMGFAQINSYTLKFDSIGNKNQLEIPLVLNEAEFTSDFVIHNTGDSTNKSNVRASWDSTGVYFYFTTNDSTLEIHQTDQDAQIFQTDDCFEIFLDFDGDGKEYLELGINPKGTYYDYWISCPATICGHWESNPNFNLDSIQIIPFINHYSTNHGGPHGIYGYEILVYIPFNSLEPFSKFGYTKPVKGTKWRANFFNINPTKKAYNAWSPTKSFGFHQPEYFGELIFSN